MFVSSRLHIIHDNLFIFNTFIKQPKAQYAWQQETLNFSEALERMDPPNIICTINFQT